MTHLWCPYGWKSERVKQWNSERVKEWKSESNYVENTSNNSKTFLLIKTKFCMLILWHYWHKFYQINFDLRDIFPKSWAYYIYSCTLFFCHIQGVSKKPQPFLSWISQRWFFQIDCLFSMLYSTAIQFCRV